MVDEVKHFMPILLLLKLKVQVNILFLQNFPCPFNMLTNIIKLYLIEFRVVVFKEREIEIPDIIQRKKVVLPVLIFGGCLG